MYKISCQSLKKIELSGLKKFPSVEIDAPNVHTLEVGPLTSEQYFSYWNVPKVHTLRLCFSADGFEPACRAGVLLEFLMKLHNCKDVILIENLLYVSFSSIDKLVKKSYIWISSNDETCFLANTLAYGCSGIDPTLYIICSSPGSIKTVHEKLSNHPSIQRVFRRVKLVTTDEEVENGMDGDLKSLMGCHPYHNAKIICSKKELANKEIV